MSSPKSSKLTSATPFPDFKPNRPVSVVFVENKSQLLVLKHLRKNPPWGLPGGKIKKGERPVTAALRELEEETSMKLTEKDLHPLGHRFVRDHRCDYILHLYSFVCPSNPHVIIDKNEHSEHKWVSMYFLDQVPTIPAHRESFASLFQDRFWQLEKRSDIQPTTQVFIKGKSTLIFNEKRRLFLNLMGPPGSGKGTSGKMLSQLFGIPHLSFGDLFRRQKTLETTPSSGKKPTYLPDNIPIGMIKDELAKAIYKKGVILDGFPRTEGQAKALRKGILSKYDLHIPLLFQMDTAALIDRVSSRYLCPSCSYQVGAIDPEKAFTYCPKDHAKGKKIKLTQRRGDVDIEIFKHRVNQFSSHQNQICDALSKRDRVHKLSLQKEMTQEEVLHRINQLIQEEFDQYSLKMTPSFSISTKQLLLWVTATLIVIATSVFFFGIIYEK